MLGFLAHPNPGFEGLGSGGQSNPGWAGAAPVAVSASADPVLPFGPDHSHDAVLEQMAVRGGVATNEGYVASFERKARGLAPARFGGLLGPLLNLVVGRSQRSKPVAEGVGPLVMRCQPESNVPVLSRLARDFAVSDHWFCSVPGETWPNRNFLHAGTSDGETSIEIRPYTDRTIFELLEDHGATWRVYHDDTPQLWAFPKLWDTPARHGNWFPAAKFAVHAAAGDLPAYTFIEPNHRPPIHLPGAPTGPGLSNSQHPDNNLTPPGGYDGDLAATDFGRGEALIAQVYEALRANPALFARTLLVITYDEHGGLYDHVPPPSGVPAPGDPPSRLARILRALWHRRAQAFDFTMLGPRVPAVIVSPLIPAGTVDHRVRDHASVPATVRALFAPDAAPLTARDAWSPAFHDLASLPEPRTDLPDLSPHIHTTAAVLPPTVTAATTLSGPLPTPTPHHYQDFVRQAEAVRDHLATLNEPETPPPTDPHLAAEVTLAFAKAAHRHRHESPTTPRRRSVPMLTGG